MGKQQQPKEERKDAILVDVRDENEFRSGYIHGAVSIPLGIPRSSGHRCAAPLYWQAGHEP